MDKREKLARKKAARHDARRDARVTRRRQELDKARQADLAVRQALSLKAIGAGTEQFLKAEGIETSEPAVTGTGALEGA